MSFLIYQKQNPEFLNNYLKYKRYISFKAKTTIDESYFDLRTLFRFLKLTLYDEEKLNNITAEEFKNIQIDDLTMEDINKVTSEDLHSFIRFLNYTLNNCPKTRNRKLASTKRFFEYLDINNLNVGNPSFGMKTATVEKRIPKHLNLTESKQLLSNVIKSDQRHKIRNYAITCIFLNCSLRLSELTGINLTDIKMDKSEKTIKIRGKGNKERIIYLDDAVCESIKSYMKVRPPLGKDNIDHDALFISEQKKRISNRTVQTIISNELKETLDESKKGYHTHSLRHTSATLMYNENDTDIFVLKKILGHKCLAATEVYTHVSDKKLKHIMENCTISSILEREGAKV